MKGKQADPAANTRTNIVLLGGMIPFTASVPVSHSAVRPPSSATRPPKTPATLGPSSGYRLSTWLLLLQINNLMNKTGSRHSTNQRCDPHKIICYLFRRRQRAFQVGDSKASGIKSGRDKDMTDSGQRCADRAQSPCVQACLAFLMAKWRMLRSARAFPLAALLVVLLAPLDKANAMYYVFDNYDHAASPCQGHLLMVTSTLAEVARMVVSIGRSLGYVRAGGNTCGRLDYYDSLIVWGCRLVSPCPTMADPPSWFGSAIRWLSSAFRPESHH